MGQFTKPVLMESLISDKNLLFYQRTALGEFFRPRDTGAMLSGNFDTIEWSVSAQNGSTTRARRSRTSSTTARASPRTSWVRARQADRGRVRRRAGHQPHGRHRLGGQQGPRRPGRDRGDFALTSGPFSLAGESRTSARATPPKLPVEGRQRPALGFDNSFVSIDPSDETSFDLTLSYLFTPEYEARSATSSARWTTPAHRRPSVEAWSAAMNKYVQGHDIKWTLQVLNTISDDDTNEILEWTLGLTVGI
jgi:hypothetical protein